MEAKVSLKPFGRVEAARFPRRRPSLALIAQRNAHEWWPVVSRREVDYIAWVKRIVDETTSLPGSLSHLSASSTLLWLRHCGVGELWALSVCCKALRGRASAGGTAGLMEVTAALLCRDSYQHLRPMLPNERAVPFGSALLPLTAGDSRMARPSWLGRLRLFRRGAMLLVRGLASKRGVAVAVSELRPEGACVELSRRPLGIEPVASKPCELLSVCNRGSLLVAQRQHDPLVEVVGRDDDDTPTDEAIGRDGSSLASEESDNEAEACKLSGRHAIRWDPSTARWQLMSLFREPWTPTRIRALTPTNFKRAMCVDSRGRLVVASSDFRRLGGNGRVRPLMQVEANEPDCDRRPWRMARRASFPAGPEEDGDQSDDKWAELPTLRPWTHTAKLDLVCIDAKPDRAPATSIDIGLFAAATAATRNDEARCSAQPDWVMDELDLADTETDFEDRSGEVTRGQHTAALDNVSLMLGQYRHEAHAWLHRRHAATTRRQVPSRDSLLVAVTTDGNKKHEFGASVYVLDELLGTWILVGVTPRKFAGWGLAACACGNAIVLASSLDNAIALVLDDLTWQPVRRQDDAAPIRAAKPYLDLHRKPDVFQLPRLILLRGPAEDATQAIVLSAADAAVYDLKCRSNMLYFSQYASATLPTSSPLKRDAPPPWTALLLPLPL